MYHTLYALTELQKIPKFPEDRDSQFHSFDLQLGETLHWLEFYKCVNADVDYNYKCVTVRNRFSTASAVQNKLLHCIHFY